METAHIRPARPGDRDAITNLSVRAWAPVFESFRSVWGAQLFERFYPDWLSQQTGDVADALDANPTWVATVEEVVAGFVNVIFGMESAVGEIYMIAVDPPFQRMGLAGRLTERATDEMRVRGMTLAIVNTGGDPGHAPARATYEKSGFVAFPQVLYSKLL